LEIISPSGKVRLPTDRVYVKESRRGFSGNCAV
jgi:hypothetical protein